MNKDSISCLIPSIIQTSLINISSYINLITTASANWYKPVKYRYIRLNKLNKFNTLIDSNYLLLE